MTSTDSLGSIKHRTASSQVGGACWEFTPTKGVTGPTVFARVLQGSRAFDVEIPICSSRYPRIGAWSIRRIAEDSWRVSCARYGADLQELTSPEPFTHGLAVGSLDLIAAPREVRDELAAIDDGVDDTTKP
jgi:hypothetical protein